MKGMQGENEMISFTLVDIADLPPVWHKRLQNDLAGNDLGPLLKDLERAADWSVRNKTTKDVYSVKRIVKRIQELIK
jgi:hypothetical protein